MKNLNLGENELKNLEGINQFRSLDNLAVNKNKITTLALQEPNKTVTYINVSDNHIPKEELELNENKIPKALVQHFPDVQGGSIDNNKPADAKDEKKEEPKQSEPNNADVQGKPASDKPALSEASGQGASNDSEHAAGSSEAELNNQAEKLENSSKPSSEEAPTAENPALKSESAQAEGQENQKDSKDKEQEEKEANH